MPRPAFQPRQPRSPNGVQTQQLTAGSTLKATHSDDGDGRQPRRRMLVSSVCSSAQQQRRLQAGLLPEHLLTGDGRDTTPCVCP